MILVTGGTGLVGTHLLVDLLYKDKKIRAIRRHTDQRLLRRIFSYHFADVEEQLKKIEWVDADLTDVFALKEAFVGGIDEVYHCAAMVSFNPKDKQKMMDINVEGTANIVNLSLLNNVKKLCHVSSIAALGRNDKPDSYTTEADLWINSRQNSNYAISKYGAEREVWRGIHEGLNAVIVNPSVIIGPGDWDKGSSQIFTTLCKGTSFYTNGVNGYVDVRDVVQAMVSLMESEITNERFVVSAENLSYFDFFSKILLKFGKNPPSINASYPLLEAGWRFEKLKSMLTGKSPLITKETARTSRNKYYYSSEKLIKALDFSFIHIDNAVDYTCTIFNKDCNY